MCVPISGERRLELGGKGLRGKDFALESLRGEFFPWK